MDKSLIFMIAINSEGTKIPTLDYAKYSIDSWEKYTLKHGIDFQVIHESIDKRLKKPIWMKEYIYQYGKKYDKIGVVDCDTIISPNAPNIFDQIDPEKFYGVNDLCDLNWLFSSIQSRQKWFPNVEMDIFKYLNAGVLFFGNRYLEIFKELLFFYFDHKEEIDNWSQGGGIEQTLLNFHLQKNKVDIELLDPAWNLLSIHRKNMFIGNWQLHPEFKGQVFKDQPESWPYFMKYAYIWHFTGFPIEDRIRMMQITHELIQE